jgi:uncharacterized protein (TIGR00661 family)
MGKNKTILVAPLYWGLGHAARCIPIINSLLENSFEVIIASDGGALLLLRKEFPELPYVELPSYEISYPRKGKNLKWKMLSRLPHIWRTMISEKNIIAKMVSEGRIDGIISDNRFGVHSKKVPSVYITHQLNVLTGSTSGLSSKIHQHIIKKFDECWVPDVSGSVNLSGILGHLKQSFSHIKYIGPLSRMQKIELPLVYNVLAIISGPEPQRTIFESKLLETFSGTKLKTLVVRGVVETEQKTIQHKNLTIINYLQSRELEMAINESEIIVSRSGYTTIMDLAAINKKAFFIPTPGQYEQKYLAKRLKNLRIVPSCSQENFSMEKLEEIPMYTCLNALKFERDFRELFGLFESE